MQRILISRCLLIGMLLSSSGFLRGPLQKILPGPVWAQSLSESWSVRRRIPNGREGAAGAFIGGLFYVSHGDTGNASLGETTNLAVYDPAADTWNFRSIARVPRAELVGVAVGGKLYAIGGRSSSFFCSTGVCDIVEIYDPVTDSWSLGAPMPTPRAGLGATVVGGKIYVVGGRTGVRPFDGTPLNVLEIYDPSTNTWARGSPMPTPRMDVYSTVAFDGKVYVIGGFNQNMGGDLRAVEIFDPGTNTWSSGPPLPTPRSNAIAGVCNGKIYVIGGTSLFIKTDVVEKFDPQTGLWDIGASLPLPGAEFAASGVSGDGIIIAAGSGLFGAGLGQTFALDCVGVNQHDQ